MVKQFPGPGASSFVPSYGGGAYYVAVDGNDNFDGLSWQTAKATILAAYDAAVGGSRIYIGDGSIVGGEVNGQGIWILGPSDSHYNSPPAGWRQYKPIWFIGVNSALPVTQFTSGAAAFYSNTFSWLSDKTKPAIWLSGFSGMRFSNLTAKGCAVGLRIGVDSTNGNRSAPTVTNIYFDNVNFALPNNNSDDGQSGPCVDSGFSFWIDWRNSVFTAYKQATVGSARRAALLLGDGTDQAPYLWTCENLIFTYAGIQMNPAGASWGLSKFSNMTVEGGDKTVPTGAVFQLGYLNSINSTGVRFGGNILLENIQTADSSGLMGDQSSVVIDSGNYPSNVVCINCGDVNGPATILGGGFMDGGTDSTPLYGSFGSVNDDVPHFVANTKIARGLGAVGSPRFKPSGLAQWPPTSGGSFTVTNVAGPVGLTAYQIAYGGGGRGEYDFYNEFLTVSAGDFIVFGAWIRAPSGAGGGGLILITNDPIRFTIPGVNKSPQPTKLFQSTPTKYAWKFCSFVATVTTGGTSISTGLSVFVFTGFPLQVAQPFLYVVPGASNSEIDIRDWAYNLGAVPPACTAGNAVLQVGQNLEFGLNTYPNTNGGRQWGYSNGAANSAPATGTYEVGSIAWNPIPTVGQPKGWMCTVAGTPGTWVSMGNL
jgi:hypothetical protein